METIKTHFNTKTLCRAAAFVSSIIRPLPTMVRFFGSTGDFGRCGRGFGDAGGEAEYQNDQ